MKVLCDSGTGLLFPFAIKIAPKTTHGLHTTSYLVVCSLTNPCPVQTRFYVCMALLLWVFNPWE